MKKSVAIQTIAFCVCSLTLLGEVSFPNPDFEVDADNDKTPDEWLIPKSTKVTLVTNKVASGSRAARFDNGYVLLNCNMSEKNLPGLKLSFSLKAAGENGAKLGVLVGYLRNIKSKDKFCYSRLMWDRLLKNEYENLKFKLRFPKDSIGERIWIGVYRSNKKGTIWLDNFKITSSREKMMTKEQTKKFGALKAITHEWGNLAKWIDKTSKMFPENTEIKELRKQVDVVLERCAKDDLTLLDEKATLWKQLAGLNKKFHKLYCRLLSMKYKGDLRLTLPKEIYGVPGVETSIYFDNAVLTPTPNAYSFKIKPEIGTTSQRRWSIIPKEKQVGKHKMEMSVAGKNKGAPSYKSEFTLKIAPQDAGKEKKLTLLVIGDSLTAATQYSRELARLLSQKGNPEWKMLGTNKKGNGVAHEGYGGWQWKTFITPGKHSHGVSPFIFKNKQGESELNINRYFQEKCDGAMPNVITILLGINDCFELQRMVDKTEAVQAGIDNIIKNADVLVGALREAAPDALIGICLTTPPNISDMAFFTNYKGAYHRYPWKQIQHAFVRRQLKHFGNREKENIFIIPTELNIDSVKGFPGNANAVHPNKTGYNQIAATIYCWLKWQLYEKHSF
jgi:lysophospholipase L1-like esterase